MTLFGSFQAGIKASPRTQDPPQGPSPKLAKKDDGRAGEPQRNVSTPEGGGLTECPHHVNIIIAQFMSVKDRIPFSKKSHENYQLVQASFTGERVDLSRKTINDQDLNIFQQCN